jgi:hypothetical protein
MFLSSPEFEDLRRYELTDAEWNALVVAREILLVSFRVPHVQVQIFMQSARSLLRFNNNYLQTKPLLSVMPFPPLRQ